LLGLLLGWEIAGLLAAGSLAGYGAKQKEINKVKEKAKQTEQDYEDLKKQNDKNIQEAGENIEADNFDNADDAADYIDNTLDNIGRGPDSK